MSSEDPPGGQEKRGMRKTMRSGLNRLKDVVRRPSSARLSSGNSDRLAAPSIGSQNLSHSLPTTPLLPLLPPSPLPADQEVDRGVIAPPPEPSSQTAVQDVEVTNVTDHKKSESRAWSRLIGSLRVLENTVELFPPLKSAVGGLIGCLGIVEVRFSLMPAIMS